MIGIPWCSVAFDIRDKNNPNGGYEPRVIYPCISDSSCRGPMIIMASAAVVTAVCCFGQVTNEKPSNATAAKNDDGITTKL